MNQHAKPKICPAPRKRIIVLILLLPFFVLTSTVACTVVGFSPGPPPTSADPSNGATSTTDYEPTDIPSSAPTPGINPSDEPSLSPTGEPASPTGQPSQSLEEFTENCQKSKAFQPGQVVYPSEVAARVGETVNYSAAIDVRAAPGTPQEVIDSNSATTNKLLVQCLVGARLTPIGAGVDVKESGADTNNWRYIGFNASGVVEWSWDITPELPTDQRVRLQLRPAVKISEGGPEEYPATADYVSDVEVTATATEKARYWIDTQGKLVGGIFTAVILAVVAVLASIGKVREAFKGLFKKEEAQAEPTSQATAQSPKRAPTKKSRPKRG